MTTEELLGRLRGVTRYRGGWKAICPAHDDRNPSLSVSVGDDGRTLLHCHADCQTTEVVGALGLTMADLSSSVDASAPRPEIAYSYTDEDGRQLYDVVRRSHPKTFRQRKADGSWGLNGTRRVLYRLPEVVAAASSGQRVYVVEGEKDADRLAGQGLTATTNPMGAGKWRPEYSAALAGADVVILPDNDEPGREHAESIRSMTPSSRIVALPGLPPKGDVSDWLDAGHTVAELGTLCDATQRRATALTVVTRDTAQGIGATNAQPIDAIPTHLPTWNEVCRGRGGRDGLARMWHVVVAAASNKGKTLFALNLTDAALAAGRSVLYILLEGALCDVMSRLYAIATGTGIDRLQPGAGYDAAVWRDTTEGFHRRNDAQGAALYFAERTGRQLPAILDALREGAASGCSLVVIDYLQLIRVPNAPSVYEATLRLSGELCEAAARENVTTLGLSQFNRGALNDKDRGMTIHGLSGGGPLENDADQVLLLDHTKAKASGLETTSEVKVAKNRHGPTRDFGVEWSWRTLRVREPVVRVAGRYNVP